MNIFITGRPGSGKSTLVKELIGFAREKGLKVSGMFSPEIREQGKRKGFELIDLESGESRVMAHVSFSGPRVSKYGVSIENIGFIVKKFKQSSSRADIVFVDELGPMELKSSKFTQTIEEIIGSEKESIIVLHRSLVGAYKERGKLFSLTYENREKIREKIACLIG